MDQDERLDQVEIDLTGVTTAHDLHAALAKSLGFPDFYGNNWNAFWDAITGLVEMPRRLVLTGWSDLSLRLPKDAEILQQSLHDLNTEFPTLGCEVDFT